MMLKGSLHLSCITIAPPLSAGLMMMSLLVDRDLMAFLSFLVRLNQLYFGSWFSCVSICCVNFL